MALRVVLLAAGLAGLASAGLAGGDGCRCPPLPGAARQQPDAGTVCGSDGNTYAAQCVLQCSRTNPDLVAVHAGPCPGAALTSKAGRAGARGYERAQDCLVSCKMENTNRLESCNGDRLCLLQSWNAAAMCFCSCGQLASSRRPRPLVQPGTDYDYADVNSCTMIHEQDMTSCIQHCDDDACRDACARDYLAGMCGCVEDPNQTTTTPLTTSEAPPTTTSEAPTTTTSEAPTTTTSEAPTTTTSEAPTTTTSEAPTTTTSEAPTTTTSEAPTTTTSEAPTTTTPKAQPATTPKSQPTTTTAPNSTLGNRGAALTGHTLLSVSFLSALVLRSYVKF